VADNETVERFIADVTQYVREVQRAARESDEFGARSREAGERARLMGLQAQEAAERAARAQARAAEAAERLAEGQGDAEEAARLAARAQRELERAEIIQARAARAAARAADEQAAEYQELTREAARAAAAQRLAQLRAAGQVREHNELLRRLREEYGDLGRDGDATFTEMTRASRGWLSFLRTAGQSTLGRMLPALLAALPTAAMLAGQGVVLGVGAALAGLGALAAAQTAQVKSAFSDLRKHVVDSLKSWARPFETTLVNITRIARRVFDAFGPDLQRIFADLAPAVEVFVEQLGDALLNFRPTLRAFSDAFRQVLSALGPQLDTVLGNIAQGLTAVADAVARNPEDLAQLIADLSQLARIAGTLAGVLINAAPTLTTFTGALGKLADGLDRVGPSASTLGSVLVTTLGAGPIGAITSTWDTFTSTLNRARGASGDTSAALAAMAVSAGHVAVAAQQHNTQTSAQAQLMRMASLSADQLKASLDQLAGKTLTAREAAAQYGQAAINLSRTIRENGRAHGFSTQKGIENEQALNQLARAAHQNAAAMRDDGRSAKEVGQFMASARKRIIDAAMGMGYSRREAVQLADKLLGVRNAANSIPKRRNLHVDANTSAARKRINDLVAWANSLVVQMAVTALTSGRAMGGYVGYAQGGPVPGYPRGGQVTGPGTSTSDSILARLSNGEFVVNAAATRMFRPVLEMINAVGLSRLSVPRAAPVPVALPSTAAAPTVQQTVVQVHVAGSVWSERELLDVVQRQAAQRNIRNPGLALFGSR